jgi:hypothetical protein
MAFKLRAYVLAYLDIDEICRLKDAGLSDAYITYDEYFDMRQIAVVRNIHDKLVLKHKTHEIGLLDIVTSKYCTLFMYMVERHMDDFPLNVLADKNWPESKLDAVFKSKKIYYLYSCRDKRVRVNSMKSAINKYNYPAILELLAMGVKPTPMDMRVAEYVNIKQISDALRYFY